MGAATILGAWLLQQAATLPSRSTAIALSAVGMTLLLVATAVPARARASVAFVAVLCCAWGWAAIRAHDALERRLDASVEGIELQVVGVVTELPVGDARGQRFRFEIERCEPDPVPGCPLHRTVRMSWASAAGAAHPPVGPGERWRLSVRLRRPHALANPGLFDAEVRAMEDGIDAIGSVRAAGGAGHQRLDAVVPGIGLSIERLRAALRERIRAALAGLSTDASAVIVALVIGEQSAISAQWWERFNRTGVGHLMSISGLHITMLAAMFAGVFDRLWRSRWLAQRMARPLAAWVPARHARWAAAVCAAFGYSLIAGWGIPAQRTCWMLAVAGLATICGRGGAPFRVLALAGAVVVVADPWAPVAAGFWLSFCAVAALLWSGAARAAAGASRGRLREAVSSQLVVTVALLPLGAVFFSTFSLIGPLANALAIPLVSVLITPLALAGAALALVSETVGQWPLQLAGWLAARLLEGLAATDGLRWSAIGLPQPSHGLLLLALAGLAIGIAPIPVPGRRWAGLACLPLLVVRPQGPGSDELWLSAIDIGQGSALLVEVGERRMLFDAGPLLGPTGDAGARTVLPYLRARGIARLDALVVSHLDADHSGGAASVLGGVEVVRLYGSLSDDHPIVRKAGGQQPCRRGEGWAWGETRFEWLHPADDPVVGRRRGSNARSCVLRIDAPGGSVLLTGDLEAPQELELLGRIAAERLRSTVIVAPHHGSRTSSTQAFLAAVQPQIAVVQAGFRNRYGHPDAGVLRRYAAIGARLLRTDHDGALQVVLARDRAPQVTRQRIEARRYWTILPGEDPATPLQPAQARDP